MRVHQPVVLVLGATGTVGRSLVAELRADDAAGRLDLVAGVRRPDAGRELGGVRTRLVDLDLPEREGSGRLVAALRDVDRLFLLTGYEVRMLAQSKAVVDAAVAAGVGHVVHLGVHAARGSSVAHHGWHQLVETYLENSGLPWTHLRPTWLMQNLLVPVGDARPGVLAGYAGDAAPSWVDAADVAAVAAAVLRDPSRHAGRAYGLGTEVATLSRVAALIGDVTGEPWRHEARDPWEFYRAVTAAGTDPVYAASARTALERLAGGGLPELSDTFDTVERLTGRAPVSLRAFLVRHRKHFTVRQRARAVA